MKPQLAAKRDYDSILSFGQVSVFQFGRAQARPLDTLQQEELGSESEVDRSPSDLLTVEQWSDVETALQIRLL